MGLIDKGRMPAPLTKLFNISRTDKNDVITEVFKSKCMLLGSPTINRGILSAVAGFLEEIKGLSFKNKRAAAFGTYGWSGESVKLIEKGLEEAGFDLLVKGIRSLWNPDTDVLRQCLDLGKEIGNRTKRNLG